MFGIFSKEIDMSYRDHDNETEVEVEKELEIDVDVKIELDPDTYSDYDSNIDVDVDVKSDIDLDGNSALLTLDVEALGDDTHVEATVAVLTVDNVMSSIVLSAFSATD
jgi:hypothetical protein